MKSTLLPGFIAAIAIFIVGMGIGLFFNVAFPTLYTEYSNTAIYRDWNDPMMWFYYFHPLLLGYILAWAWKATKPLFTKGMSNRIMRFTLAYWLIAIIPGMLMTISSFQVSMLMVLTWTASTFFQAMAASFVYAKMLK